jgi:hypothetical protein
MSKKFTPNNHKSTPKLPVQRVAAPGEAWLELKGTILVYHKRSWVGSSSMFIPVEWVQVHHEMRHDWRRLWRGIIAVMIAFLVSFPLTLLLVKQPDHAWAEWASILLSAVMAFSCGLGIYLLLSFVRPRAVTELQIEHQPRIQRIAFWHAWGRRPELDSLINQLKGFQVHPEKKIPFPVRMKHIWYKPRPYRLAFVRGLAISFIMYMALCVMELLVLLGQIPPLSNWYYLLLLAPPIFYMLQQGLMFGIISNNSREYIQAVRAYIKGDLNTAAQLLHKLLDEDPDEATARLLLIQILTEQYAFDDASNHCKKIAIDHPDLATHLESNIWGVKRMHERMHGSEE